MLEVVNLLGASNKELMHYMSQSPSKKYMSLSLSLHLSKYNILSCYGTQWMAKAYR